MAIQNRLQRVLLLILSSFLLNICSNAFNSSAVAGSVYVNANNDGQAGDPFKLAQEAYNSTSGSKTNYVPSAPGSLLSFKPTAACSAESVEIGFTNAVPLPPTSGVLYLFQDSSPMLQPTSTPLSAVQCSTWQNRVVCCTAGPAFPLSPNAYYHLAQSISATYNDAVPPSLDIKPGLSQADTLDAGITIYKQGGGTDELASTPVAHFFNQLAGCVTRKADEVLDIATNGRTFEKGKKTTSAAVSTYDRNAVDTSDAGLTNCAEGSGSIDDQSYVDTFLLSQSGSPLSFNVDLEGSDQPAISSVKVGTETLNRNSTIGGWRTMSVAGSTTTFDVTVDGINTMDPAMFTIDVTLDGMTFAGRIMTGMDSGSRVIPDRFSNVGTTKRTNGDPGISVDDGSDANVFTPANASHLDDASAGTWAYGAAVLDCGKILVGHTCITTYVLAAADYPGDELTNILLAPPMQGSGFSVLADHCTGRTLQTGEYCTIDFRFSPRSRGNYEAEFTIGLTLIAGQSTTEIEVTPKLTGSAIADQNPAQDTRQAIPVSTLSPWGMWLWGFLLLGAFLLVIRRKPRPFP